MLPEPSESADRDRRAALIGIAVATAVALAVRLWGLRADSIWGDEAVTWRTAALPWAKVLKSFRSINLPAWFAVTKGSIALLGASEVGLRLPAALAMTAAVPFTGWLGLRIAGPGAGVVAASIAALASNLVHFGEEARAYGLLVLGSAAALVALDRALDLDEDPAAPRPARIRAGLLLGLAVAVMMHAHPYGGLEAAGLGLFVLWRWVSTRRFPLACAVGLGLAAALFLPVVRLLLWRVRAVSKRFWIEPMPPFDMAEVPAQLVAYQADGAAALAIAAVVLVSTWALPPRWRGVAAAGALACWLGPAVWGHLGKALFVSRYAMGLAPIAFVAVGAGVARLPRRAALAAGAAIVLLLGLELARYEATRPHRTDWRGAAEALVKAAEGGTRRAIFIDTNRSGDFEALRYYMGDRKFELWRRGRTDREKFVPVLPAGRVAVLMTASLRDDVMLALAFHPVRVERRFEGLVLIEAR